MLKVVDRIEHRGCDLCGTILGGPIPHHFGRRNGKLVGVCHDCVKRLDGRPCASGLFDSPPPWQEDDRNWFIENPCREFRLRNPIGLELAAITKAAECSTPSPPSGHNLAIAVWQYDAGRRIRRIVYPASPVDTYTEAGIRTLIPWQSLSKDEVSANVLDRIERETKLSLRLIAEAGNESKMNV
jgi:hypothetical protein